MNHKNKPANLPSKLPLVILLIGLVIFLLAYVGMTFDFFNQPVLDWLINHRQQNANIFFTLVSNAFSPEVVIITTILLSSFYIKIKKEVWRPLLMTSAILSSALISNLLKNTIANSRPDYSSMIAPVANDFSFPSGHVLLASVFLLVIGYLALSRKFSKQKLIIWIVASSSVIILVALSRLYLGYHWLTDVVASVGLGLIILAVVMVVDNYYYNHLSKVSSSNTDL